MNDTNTRERILAMTRECLQQENGINHITVGKVAEEVERAEREESDIESQLMRLITILLAEAKKRSGVVRYILFEADLYPDVARLATKHSIGRAFPLLVQLFEHHERRGVLRPGSAQVRVQAFLGMLLVMILFRADVRLSIIARR